MFANWKQILILALPSVVSFATTTVTGSINLIMVGHLGATAIAIVGITNIVMYNAWALFSGIGNSIQYLVSQNIGAGQEKLAVQRMYMATYVCLLVGVLICAAGYFWSEPLLTLISGTDRYNAMGGGYVRFRFYALAFGVLNFAVQGFFRGTGDTRSPAVLAFAGSAIMSVLTYALTYGKLGFPELGLRGAGIAFLAGEAFGLIGGAFIFLVMKHRHLGTRVRSGWLPAEGRLLLVESGKLGLQEFSLSIAMFLFTMFVARLGTTALAANEVSLNVMSLGFMPAFAFGATATILVGQEIGRRRPAAAKRAGTDTAVLGSMFLLALGTLEFFLAEHIARVYTSDAAVYHLAGRLIMISAFLQLFDGLLNFYAGSLRGIGDTSFLLVNSLIMSFALFVPLTYVLTFALHWGSVGAWISLYAYLTVFGTSLLIRFYRTDWLSVTAKEAKN